MSKLFTRFISERNNFELWCFVGGGGGRLERKNKEQIEGLGLLSGGWKRECGGAISKETNWGFGGGNGVKRSKKKQIGGFEVTKW